MYTGTDAAFDLYEDEGINYNYENGAYAIIPINWSESTRELIVGHRTGEFPGMLKERAFRIVFVTKEKGVSIDESDVFSQEVQYNGEEITVELE